MEGDLTPNFMSHHIDGGPRIFVACLSSHHAGMQHGRWLDAAQETDELREEIALMLEDSPTPNAREWAIHDHEGFSPLTLDEHEDLGEVNEAARLIADYGPIAAHILVFEGGFGQHEPARAALEKRYIGAYGSAADWVDEQIETGAYGPVDRRLLPYIDRERLALDQHLGSELESFDVDGIIHLFRPAN